MIFFFLVKIRSKVIQDLNSLISQLENKMRAFNEKIGVFEEKLRERDDYVIYYSQKVI